MKVLPKGFKISALPLGCGEPSLVRRCKEFLDALPFQELVNTSELAGRAGCQVGTLLRFTGSPAMREYRHDLSYNRPVWGSKRTIKELKRQLAKQDDE